MQLDTHLGFRFVLGLNEGVQVCQAGLGPVHRCLPVQAKCSGQRQKSNGPSMGPAESDGPRDLGFGAELTRVSQVGKFGHNPENMKKEE